MKTFFTTAEGTAVVETFPGREPGVVSIIPRVKIGESVARELERLFGNKARVNYDPSATFISIEVEDIRLDEELRQIVEFLRNHPGKWWFPYY